MNNAFYRVGNWQRAQVLADRIGSRRWPRLLGHLASWVNPYLPLFAKANFGTYYWVADQAEISTDITFRTRPALEQILPATFAHTASAFSAEDVLRFLGRKLTPTLAAEVNTDARRRPEGWRIKHRMGRNHVKLYDKGPVLRVETTINRPDQFRVLRVKDGHRAWCPMKKGVADLYRFCQVGRASNQRYLEGLAAAPDHRPGVVALDWLCRPRRNRGRHHPRLNPINNKDLALFRAVWPASTPSSASATPTSNNASGTDRPPTPPRPNAAAPTSADNSPNSAATASSPKSHTTASTGSPPTAKES